MWPLRPNHTNMNLPLQNLVYKYKTLYDVLNSLEKEDKDFNIVYKEICDLRM